MCRAIALGVRHVRIDAHRVAAREDGRAVLACGLCVPPPCNVCFSPTLAARAMRSCAGRGISAGRGSIGRLERGGGSSGQRRAQLGLGCVEHEHEHAVLSMRCDGWLRGVWSMCRSGMFLELRPLCCLVARSCVDCPLWGAHGACVVSDRTCQHTSHLPARAEMRKKLHHNTARPMARPPRTCPPPGNFVTPAAASALKGRVSVADGSKWPDQRVSLSGSPKIFLVTVKKRAI